MQEISDMMQFNSSLSWTKAEWVMGYKWSFWFQENLNVNKSEEKNSGQISVASKGDRFRECMIYVTKTRGTWVEVDDKKLKGKTIWSMGAEEGFQSLPWISFCGVKPYYLPYLEFCEIRRQREPAFDIRWTWHFNNSTILLKNWKWRQSQATSQCSWRRESREAASRWTSRQRSGLAQTCKKT